MKKKLFLLLFFLFPVSGYSLTLSQLRTNTRVLIKDTSSTRQRYTDAYLNTFLNEGQRDAINNSWIISKSTSITLVTGTTYYALPTDVICLQRVTFQKRNLPEQALTGLDGYFSNAAWENSGGTPVNYFQDPSQTTKIGFYPWPNSSSSTGTVKVFYYSQGTDMSADSDVPFNGEVRFYPYHDLLEYFASYRVYLLEGEQDKAALYRQEYENRLLLMVGRFSAKQNYQPHFSAGGTR